jgi:rare lipoprotein A
LLAGLAGCSATRWEEPVARSDEIAPASQDMTRTRRGNPPFYEVFGVRYQVMTSSDGYAERGVASWYGKKFHGRQTSNGERYDMYRMTAAHKTLPLPTNVRVTNLRNGRSVIVRVNDRGPFVKNRLIDLSYAAARELDMITTGTAPVEIVALDTGYTGAITTASATATAPAAGSPTAGLSPIAGAHAATPVPAGSTPLMYLQVGAFGDASNAERLANRLTEEGIAPVAVHEPAGGAPALYRVRIGPFSDVGDYDRVVARVTSLDINQTQLVVEDSLPAPRP